MKFPPIDQLQNDVSNTGVRSDLRQAGWKRRPIIRFGEHEYIPLHHIYPRPGPMCIDVINVTQFDHNSKFPVFRLRPYPWAENQDAYVIFTDDGIGVLTVYHAKLTEWPQPTMAVLTFRIEPPTPEDIGITQQELDNQLQERFDWPIC